MVRVPFSVVVVVVVIYWVVYRVFFLKIYTFSLYGVGRVDRLIETEAVFMLAIYQTLVFCFVSFVIQYEKTKKKNQRLMEKLHGRPLGTLFFGR